MIGRTVLVRAKRFRLMALLLAGLCMICQMAHAGYWIQAATYSKPFYAERMAKSLAATGFSAGLRKVEAANNKHLIQLLLGPYPNRQAAEKDLLRLKSLGHGSDGLIREYEAGIKVEKEGTLARDVEVAPALPQTPAAVPGFPSVEEPAAETEEQTEVPSAPVDESSPEVASHSFTVQPKTQSLPVTTPPQVEDLFGLDAEQGLAATRITGFFQSELAYAEAAPEHLSKFRQMLEVGAEGHFTTDMTWKISGRVAYDAVFDLTDFYPTSVRDNQQLERSLRETYMDVSAGDWDFRLGRQQIIWGEMVGLFFADVVSAKDLREFVLPEFDVMRIPQWALRSEYFKGEFHGEAIWIPYPTYDNIGVPGAEFYPYPTPPPLGYGMDIRGEHRPAGRLSDSNYGLRLSDLVNGWDLSAFYYSSMDTSATFFRKVVTTPVPVVVYSPDHKRIRQVGGTLSKGYMDSVLKVEMVYTLDRWYAVDTLSDSDGVVQKDTLDYAVGLDYNLPNSSRLNVQFFQRWFPDYDSAMSAKRLESGASFYASTKLLDGNLEPQLLVIASLNRGDWLARPKVVWTLSGNWRWLMGADIFTGSRTGLFGQYDDKDRIYTELRYVF